MRPKPDVMLITNGHNYDRAMGKAVALSNAVLRSAKSSELVEEVTGSTFLRPTVQYAVCRPVRNFCYKYLNTAQHLNN